MRLRLTSGHDCSHSCLRANALQSVYGMLRNRLCSHFYLRSSSCVVCFMSVVNSIQCISIFYRDSLRSGTGGECRAVMTRSTRAVRTLLEKEGQSIRDRTIKLVSHFQNQRCRSKCHFTKSRSKKATKKIDSHARSCLNFLVNTDRKSR